MRREPAAVAGALADTLQRRALQTVLDEQLDRGLGEQPVGQRGALRLLAALGWFWFDGVRSGHMA